jgi:DNA-binding NarL/FixJ family response regulator
MPIADVRRSPGQSPLRDPVGMSDAQLPPRLPGVAIVSADRRVCDGLASLLAAGGQARVLGPVGDGPAALDLVRETDPDAVVVDITVAGHADRAPLLAELRRLAPRTRLLVIAWGGEVDRGLGRGIVDGYVEADGRSPALLEEVLREAPPAH